MVWREIASAAAAFLTSLHRKRSSAFHQSTLWSRGICSSWPSQDRSRVSGEAKAEGQRICKGPKWYTHLVGMLQRSSNDAKFCCLILHRNWRKMSNRERQWKPCMSKGLFVEILNFWERTSWITYFEQGRTTQRIIFFILSWVFKITWFPPKNESKASSFILSTRDNNQIEIDIMMPSSFLLLKCIFVIVVDYFIVVWVHRRSTFCKLSIIVVTNFLFYSHCTVRASTKLQSSKINILVTAAATWPCLLQNRLTP